MEINWRDKAACLGVDTNLFFPAIGDGTTVKQALAICNGDANNPACPVKDECRQFIMSFEQDEDVAGIFGGLTAGERKKIRKQRKIERVSDIAVTADRQQSGDLYTYQLGMLLNAVHVAVKDRL